MELRNLPEYKELLELKCLKKQKLQEIQEEKGGVQHVGFKVKQSMIKSVSNMRCTNVLALSVISAVSSSQRGSACVPAVDSALFLMVSGCVVCSVCKSNRTCSFQEASIRPVAIINQLIA